MSARWVSAKLNSAVALFYPQDMTYRATAWRRQLWRKRYNISIRRRTNTKNKAKADRYQTCNRYLHGMCDNQISTTPLDILQKDLQDVAEAYASVVSASSSDVEHTSESFCSDTEIFPPTPPVKKHRAEASCSKGPAQSLSQFWVIGMKSGAMLLCYADP